MKMRTLLTMSFVAAGVFANAALDMDQISNVAGTHDADTFGGSQIIGDGPSFSSMVLADVNLTGGTISQIDAGFGFSRAAALNLVTGWRISVFSSAGAGFGSGTGLSGGALATVDVANGAAIKTALVGSGSGSTATLVSLQGLNLNVGTGMRWIGVAAILNGGANFDQAFVLANSTPAQVGGAAGNDVAVQPGDGFGFGGPTAIDTTANAAYAVTTVPEPATMIALGAGLAALARKRRK